MSKLKDSSIGIGGTPSPLSKYTTNHGPQSSPTQVPRDNGGLSDGTTGGNFDLGSMTKIPNNPGSTGTQSGTDASKAAQEGNAQ